MCMVDCCPNPRRPDGGGLCWTHTKRKWRTGSVHEENDLRPYGLEPRQLLLMAAIRLADLRATDDAGWRLAWNQLRMAARRYVLGTREDDETEAKPWRRRARARRAVKCQAE